jgi:hypothetical protein
MVNKRQGTNCQKLINIVQKSCKIIVNTSGKHRQTSGKHSVVKQSGKQRQQMAAIVKNM